MAFSPYKWGAKISFYERQIEYLKRLLAKHNIDYEPLGQVDMEQYVGFYLTIYRKQSGYVFGKITKGHPWHRLDAMRPGDINSYGWECLYVLQCTIPQYVKRKK